MKYLLKFLVLIGTLSSLVEAQSIPNLPEKCSCGQTARFAVCADQVPDDVVYRPSFSGCSGKAAVILKGQFTNSFSVVLRDSQNRDRFPVSGYGGCSFSLANSVSPPKRCSAFKASREYFSQINGESVRVVCFPERGNSSLYKDVRRVTIKVKNSAASLRRYCIGKAVNSLN
jgi:hypothetical protein